VQAFSAKAGADSPIWSFWPESVDMDLAWELVGSPAPIAAGVDTVVMQYSNELFTREDANCTLWGVSTSPSAAAFVPVWTAKVPHCAPTYQPNNDGKSQREPPRAPKTHAPKKQTRTQTLPPPKTDYGQWRSLAITPDGSTLIASLVISNVEMLYGFSLASGALVFAAPTDGASYGVALSGDGKWALVASDDGNGGRAAWAYSTATGKQRGTSGCRMSWNAVPAISDDASVIATGAYQPPIRTR
jgi:hypothetical protein